VGNRETLLLGIRTHNKSSLSDGDEKSETTEAKHITPHTFCCLLPTCAEELLKQVNNNKVRVRVREESATTAKRF
jgi:hypothetical protein